MPAAAMLGVGGTCGRRLDQPAVVNLEGLPRLRTIDAFNNYLIHV